MAEDAHLTPRPRSAIEPCWLCGTRLPATQLVADGGSACASVRWYCRDVRGCTERWTTRQASRLPVAAAGRAGTP